MPSPFPGMDPYLEHPTLWPDVHARLIVELGRALGPRLSPRFIVRVEERTYLDAEGLVFVGRPDVSVKDTSGPAQPAQRGAVDPIGAAHVVAVDVPMPDHVRETWLEVRSVPAGEVVTVLEILSPANKRTGKGRSLYEEKRLTVLGTRTHLVEIDLLRGGQAMAMRPAPAVASYRLLVSRGDRRPKAELATFSVREPIPTFRLPLRGGAEEPVVSLRAILDETYDTARYDLSIDYAGDPEPRLSGEDTEWADALLRRAGRRG